MKTCCPTCGSIDRDVFLPVVLFFYVRMCPDAWHEDRIVKSARPKKNQRKPRAKAASRQEKTI